MSNIVDIIEPVGEHFLVEVDAEIEELAGSIVAPERHREAQQIGTVVKVGRQAPTDIAVGRRVIFSKYAGMDFGIEGETGSDRKTVKMMVPLDLLGYIADEHMAIWDASDS